MRSLAFIFFILFFSTNLFSQITPSSCEGEPSVIAQYHFDAQVLALQHIFDSELTYMDSVDIPEEITNSILDALLAVYNVDGVPEADSVTTVYNVHSFPYYALNSVLVVGDESLPWIQDLINGVFPTSDPSLNEIINTYGLTLTNTFSIGTSTLAEFTSSENYNVVALGDLLGNVPGASYGSPNGYAGDGNDIDVVVTDSYTMLDYSIGWGDCPAGCICHRHWVFNVYPDCSVEFINTYGCPLEPVGINTTEKTSYKVYPNPFNDQIIIENAIPGSSFFLTNQYGQTVLEGNLLNNSITDLSNISSGLYFLTIIDERNTSTISLIKD